MPDPEGSYYESNVGLGLVPDRGGDKPRHYDKKKKGRLKAAPSWYPLSSPVVKSLFLPYKRGLR